MQFLSPAEWQAWCVARQVPLREVGWIRPDLRAHGYYVSALRYPSDSGRKVFLASQLVPRIASEGESLIVVDDWAVFPSRQHLPLFTRFREAIGEQRPLIEAPGHLVHPGEIDDAISIVAICLYFFWDCYGISASGRSGFYISHDEYCCFASRDPDIAARVSSDFGEIGYA